MVGGSDDPPDAAEKTCKICFKTLERRALKHAIKCKATKCGVIIHEDCFDSVSKVFSIEKLNWCCRNCTDTSNSSAGWSDSCLNDQIAVLKKENECLLREKELLNKLLEDKDYTLSLQKSVINDISKKTVSTCLASHTLEKHQYSSYSDIVKTKQTNTLSPVLLIKTTDNSVTNKMVEKEVKSKITPGSINVDVNNTKLIKDGLLISCANQESLNILKDNLQTKISSKFKICEPAKFNPRLLIKNVNKDCIEDSNLIEKIISDNNLHAYTRDFKFVTKFAYKSVYNVVLEVTPPVFQQIIKNEFLYIGWTKCFVQEHFSLPRCFKCCKFGHYMNNCRSSSLVCPICSESHEKKDCTSNVKSCSNCKDINTKYKSNMPTDHTASDINCGFFKYKIEQLKLRINYE